MSSQTIKIVDVKSKRILKEFQYYDAQSAIQYAAKKEAEGFEIKIAIPKKLAESYEDDSDYSLDFQSTLN